MLARGVASNKQAEAGKENKGGGAGTDAQEGVAGEEKAASSSACV